MLVMLVTNDQWEINVAYVVVKAALGRWVKMNSYFLNVRGASLS